MHTFRFQLPKLDLQNFLLIKLQSCIFFCLATRVSNAVIKLSTSSSAMCRCLVRSACKSSQCLPRSCYMSFLVQAIGPWPFTSEFLYSGYRHLCVQVLKLCVPVARANLYHQRAQGAVWLWHGEECGCAPALPAVLALYNLGCCFWRDWDTLPVFLASLFTLLEAPETLFATLYFFWFALTPWAGCKITWVLQVSYLSVFVQNPALERGNEAGRSMSG